jgi:hypothetical protein
MHGRHVGPSVERQSFIGGQSSTHTRSNDIEQGPTTGSLGEGQQDVIHARPVTEVEDAAVALKAARINPTLDSEVGITKQVVVTHVDVVYVSFEGETQ